MPTPDDYGQGVAIASLTDAPDASKLAKELANALAQRGVMRFASASARGATITPVEGMLTWLQDINRLDVYDGSAWVAVSVGTSSWTTITPESGWSQNGNSNGTFQCRLLNISGEESLQFRGALGRSSYPSTPADSYVVNNTALPSSKRPSTLRTVLVPCSDVSSVRIALKMDVRTDGYLEIFGFSSSVKPPWVGFNGVIVSL